MNQRLRRGDNEENAVQTLPVTVTVNGDEYTAEVEPRLLLVHFIELQESFWNGSFGSQESPSNR